MRPTPEPEEQDAQELRDDRWVRNPLSAPAHSQRHPQARQQGPNADVRNALGAAREAREQARGALSPESAQILYQQSAAYLDQAHDARGLTPAMRNAPTDTAHRRMRTEQQVIDQRMMARDYGAPEI